MLFSEGTATTSSAWSTGRRCTNSGCKFFPSTQCGHQEGERGEGQEAQVNDTGHCRAAVGKEEENCENLFCQLFQIKLYFQEQQPKKASKAGEKDKKTKNKEAALAKQQKRNSQLLLPAGNAAQQQMAGCSKMNVRVEPSAPPMFLTLQQHHFNWNFKFYDSFAIKNILKNCQFCSYSTSFQPFAITAVWYNNCVIFIS